MKFFDAHCDTLYEATTRELSMSENTLHIDFKRLKDIGSYTQFFAAWIEDDDFELFKKMADKLKEETDKNSDLVSLCRTFEDMEAAHKSGKLAAFLTLEGSGFLKSAEDVSRLKSYGVKAATLTWNSQNALAGGVNSSIGVTELGRAVVENMQSEGIITDVSHLNEKSFWDVIEISKKPIIASHSNCRSICKNKRNLSDEQIVAISNSGGVTGVNFYPPFLNESERASAEDIIRHIKHIVNIGGEESVGIGTDFDGIKKLPIGIRDVSFMKNLPEKLMDAGLGYGLCEKIMFKNFERILKV